MKTLKSNTRKPIRVVFISILFFFLIFPTLFMLMINNQNDNSNNQQQTYIDEPRIPLTSSILGEINLTNPQEVNNTEFTHGDTIQIEGKIYSFVPFGIGVQDLNVSVLINGQLNNKFNDTTDADGIFKISFEIPLSMNIFDPSTLQVNITDNLGGNSYEIINFYSIDVNASSGFKVDWLNTYNIANPIMPGESFTIEGNLELDNGTGMGGITYDREWINETTTWSNGSDPTIVNGFFSDTLDIPVQTTTDNISLKFSYDSALGLFDHTNLTLFFKVFKNISCIWNIVNNIAEGQGITIQGRVVSLTNQSMGIRGRVITIYYNGNPIPITPTTDSNGNFSVIYQVPTGTGIVPIQIGIYDSYNGWTILSEEAHNVTVSVAPAQTGDIPPTAPPAAPFGDFLIILLPIIAVVGGVLAVLGYLFLKKQEQEAMSVSVPLEGRIRNLKILKDTGRLEEALSYLFNAIYMDLIKGKYGRTKKLSETIRDFAIVSVKELKLSPTTIYPFIQKVEEIIYARPYSITDRDFYDACGLFSPIYLQLTGSNFVLNF